MAENDPPSGPAETRRRPLVERLKSRDGGLALGGALGLLGLMAWPGQHRVGVVVGLLCTLAATLGLLGLLGDSPLDLRGDEKTADPDAPPWWKTPLGWVLIVSGLLYLPMAGAFGLWDPWETHYMEVAREILSRDDWITLWWAQEGWFMSKPILIFWMGALGMGFGTMFGLDVGADAGPQWQEWCIRVPIVLLAMAALVALYRAVSSAFGKRAGLLSALVLATMPQWFFLAHQAMTDMPFVATLTLALSMFGLALTAGPEALAEAHEVRLFGRRVRVSLWHLAVGAVLVFSLPQIAYLLTRPMVLGCPGDATAQCRQIAALNRVGGVQLPFEMFYSGSPGNSGVDGAPSLPGSPAWERVASSVALFPSALQGAVWAVVLAWALSILQHEKKREGLYFTLFYLWCAISTMGKGPAGLVIPGAVAFLHYAAAGDWAGLKRVRLGLGVLVFLVIGMPWYVAITGRLGNEFIQRFVVHDIINRTVAGVHGDTGSVRYFILQLGYAMFPWSGLVPVAVAGWRTVLGPSPSVAEKAIARLGLYWFGFAFVLFSAMVTKFHHYIFPALPGAAVMVGLTLDKMLPRSASGSRGARVPSLIVQGLGFAMVVYGAARCVGPFSAALPAGTSPAPAGHLGLGVTMLVLGVAALGAGWALGRADDADDGAQDDASAGWSGLAIFAVGVVGLVARDMTAVRSNPPGGERLIHLFVYNYDRAWPGPYLDFRPAFLGFGVAAMVAMALIAVPRLRAYGVRGAVVFASLFALWTLDVYMIDLTPHWSQRGLFARYYAMRRARPNAADARYRFDPVVAHQMNWKGENFYTGNHVVAMECGLKYCTGTSNEWMRQHPGERAFFVTEHGRVETLLSNIRNTGGDGRTVTTARDDNKFVLVEATLGNGRRP
ncbi:MAG: glycosyltransferase family 39 protein [Myxococcales bacterium]|nr:glycosyltransferase family 39 protein [Myxococcales bacterium]